MDLITDRLLRHMAWANAYVFDCLAQLTQAELEFCAPQDDWTGAAILEHLTAGRYANLLDGLGQPETVVPKNSADVLALKELSATFDARLREAAQQPAGFVEFNRGERVIRRARQTVISQSIHHATEHRAQIAGIYSSHGHKVVDLDAIDLWEFANFEDLGD